MMDLIVDFPHCPHQRPRVSFEDEIAVTFVEGLDKHKDDLWFCKGEYQDFKRRAAHTIRAITSNMTMAEFAEINVQETSAFLGLEAYFSEDTSRNIRLRKAAALDAVLREQSRQWRGGISDPDAMAHVSQVVSDLSRRRAHIIALVHAEKRDRPKSFRDS